MVCGVEGAKIPGGRTAVLAVLPRSHRRSSKLGPATQCAGDPASLRALRADHVPGSEPHVYTRSFILAPSPVTQGAEDIIILFLQVNRLRLRDD